MTDDHVFEDALKNMKLALKSKGNLTRIIPILQKLAEQEHREAQYALGTLSLNGFIELDKGIEWLKKSSQHECAGASGILGMIYLSKESGKYDLPKAKNYLMKATEHGEASSQTILFA